MKMNSWRNTESFSLRLLLSYLWMKCTTHCRAQNLSTCSLIKFTKIATHHRHHNIDLRLGSPKSSPLLVTKFTDAPLACNWICRNSYQIQKHAKLVLPQLENEDAPIFTPSAQAPVYKNRVLSWRPQNVTRFVAKHSEKILGVLKFIILSVFWPNNIRDLLLRHSTTANCGEKKVQCLFQVS